MSNGKILGKKDINPRKNTSGLWSINEYSQEIKDLNWNGIAIATGGYTYYTTEQGARYATHMFMTPGTTTFTVNSGSTMARVLIVGGGGGGGTSGQGYAGGTAPAGNSNGGWDQGGGGGAGGPGSSYNPGPGVTNSISGSPVTYAAGGRGMGPSTAAANTGNGGRGAATSADATGGSGIVIIRYLI